MAYKALHYAYFLLFIAIAQTGSSISGIQDVQPPCGNFPRPFPAYLAYLVVPMLAMTVSHLAEELVYRRRRRPSSVRRRLTSPARRLQAEKTEDVEATKKKKKMAVKGRAKAQTKIIWDLFRLSPLLWEAVTLAGQVFEHMLVSSNIVLTVLILVKELTLEVPTFPAVLLRFLVDPVHLWAAVAYGGRQPF